MSEADNGAVGVPALAPAPRAVQISGFVLIMCAALAILYYLWSGKKSVSEIDAIDTQSQTDVEDAQGRADPIDALSRGLLDEPDEDVDFISLDGLALPADEALDEQERARRARLEARRTAPAAVFVAGAAGGGARGGRGCGSLGHGPGGRAARSGSHAGAASGARGACDAERAGAAQRAGTGALPG